MLLPFLAEAFFWQGWVGIVSKRSQVLQDCTVLGSLSPLQRKILCELAAGPLTLVNLSERTGASVYTVGKQLSLLQFRTKYNPLARKGVCRPLVRKNKDAGVKTSYFLNVPQ